MRVDEAIAAVKRNSSHAGELIDDNYIATEVASVLVDEVEELEAALADMTEARDALAVQFEFAKAELWCFDDRIMYASVMDSYERLGAKVKELCAALAERVAEIKLLQEELIEARTHYGFGPGRRYQIMNCDHPWHRNPGLITICPQCAISAAKEADRVATTGPALIIPTIGPTPGTAVLAAKGEN